MDVIRKYELLERHVVFTQTLYQIHCLANRYIAIVISVNEQHG